MIGLLVIWIIHFIFLLFSYMVLQGVAIFFSLLLKPIFPYEKCFFQNPVTYCNMAIYCNGPITQYIYGIDLYSFTPTWYDN